jgi:hypothetical protein
LPHKKKDPSKRKLQLTRNMQREVQFSTYMSIAQDEKNDGSYLDLEKIPLKRIRPMEKRDDSHFK